MRPMSRWNHERVRHAAAAETSGDETGSSGFVFGGMGLLLFASALLVPGPWAGFHAVLFGAVALLMALWPSRVALPTVWWVLAGVFVLASTAAFLPAPWFGIPEWRNQLEALGVDTGSQVTIQSRMAAESLAVFAIILMVGFWLAGHRPASSQLRLWALAFTVGVACYAVISRIALEMPLFSDGFSRQRYGFFPNRNHTATYLSMGAICGLGCVLQALRDKRFVILALALAATAICLWAIASWSISRAGVVLVAIGGVLWIAMLGRRYLGRHGVWAISLIAITAVGLFLIANTEVRERITSTVEKTGAVIADEGRDDPEALRTALDSGIYLDFRIPVFLDTFQLMREFPWTGVGAGQYYYVIPQYRDHTIIASDAYVFHPESDWLWMASEVGVLGMLALLALVVLACWQSHRDIRQGRDRALRAGCLVAAMLVPIHGIFDVPGHRITLAWSAVFLFALSQHPVAASSGSAAGRAWFSRVFAVVLIVATAYLVRVQWFGGSPPAITTAAETIAQTEQLYREDQSLQQTASDAGLEYQPDPTDDKLLRAIAIIEAAQSRVPMDRRLLRHEAFLALHFDDQNDRIARAFEIGRALEPTWVVLVMRQAEAWIGIDPERTGALWEEAIQRSLAIDRIDPNNRWSSERVMERIRRLAARHPELEPHVPDPDR